MTIDKWQAQIVVFNLRKELKTWCNVECRLLRACKSKAHFFSREGEIMNYKQ